MNTGGGLYYNKELERSGTRGEGKGWDMQKAEVGGKAPSNLFDLGGSEVSETRGPFRKNEKAPDDKKEKKRLNRGVSVETSMEKKSLSSWPKGQTGRGSQGGKWGQVKGWAERKGGGNDRSLASGRKETEFMAVARDSADPIFV